MFIDVVAVILSIWAIYKGFTKGLVVGIFSFLSFMIGLAAAIKLSAVAADFIGRSTNIPEKWLPFLAFLSVFTLIVLLVRLGAKAIEGMLKLAMLGWANRLGGITFYLFLHLFIFSILLFYLQRLQVIKPPVFEASVFYSYIQPIAPALMNFVGTVIPLFKNMFAELEQFFGGFTQSGLHRL